MGEVEEIEIGKIVVMVDEVVVMVDEVAETGEVEKEASSPPAS